MSGITDLFKNPVETTVNSLISGAGDIISRLKADPTKVAEMEEAFKELQLKAVVSTDQLTATLADKVVDMLLREDYGQMPVMKRIVPFVELEEFNTSAIDMGAVGNKPLSDEYYDINRFSFTDAYADFLTNILEKPDYPEFKYHFPVVLPE